MNRKIRVKGFYIKSVPLMAYLCFLVLLLSLGNWQLTRSKEKAVYISELNRSADLPKIPLTADLIEAAKSLRFQAVEVSGRYDDQHQFLLDNQVRRGKVGYFVMTPFYLTGSTIAILVNRGWIPANLDRNQLPDIAVHENQITISGRINQFPGLGVKLKGAEIPTDTWPSVVQLIDSQVLAKIINRPLADFQIELHPESPDGYERSWHISVEITPEKHIAYAIQWFGLALTLTILFVWYSIKKSNE
ncbi:SURF1 family protein [Methylicorpusculum sp.]|uniref:SURF1 family protein n=1 Tax=Methylicorpusculum sp. TaxID=2713644 RepID=UPI00272FDDFB|nr:SURF1 family protein [Methylicorpusculum sp.]MDP2177449.1 SURF1 family protein [Methylicorpusculum sp.]MDP3530205.1 SURF1 family protein [Methylicorpusculum sp.]